MSLKESTVSSVSGFVEHILSSPSSGPLWFRGQGCHRRDLRSSLVRKLDPYTPAALIAMEERLITRFRQRSLPLWPEGYPQSDWEHLFAMQHFGVPTRLLDWTENALVSAYFAIDHNPALCECKQLDCQPTIWVLDPVLLNRGNKRLDGFGDSISIFATSDKTIEPWAPRTDETRFAPDPIALYGTHNSARIVAQQGTFTVSGKANTALEATQAVVENDGVLEKIVVDADRATISRQLRLLGVSRGSVYPDLGGLATDITDAELGR